LADSVQAQLEAMRRAVPEACVTRHEPQIETLALPDADDRHALATAIRCNAQHIVTDNLEDLPEDIFSEFAIEQACVATQAGAGVSIGQKASAN
jgi:hypothetical protein